MAAIATAAPKIDSSTVSPKDCAKRLAKVDQSFQESLIILDPKQILYYDQQDFNINYCG